MPTRAAWILALSCPLACGGGGGTSATTVTSDTTAQGGTSTGTSGATHTSTDAPTGSGSGGASSGHAATSSTGASPTASSTPTEASSSGSASTGAAGPCGDEFTDPQGDGSLRLSGDEVFVLGPGPYTFSSICVQDSARLLVCDETTIFLGDAATTVIEGNGIGPFGQLPVKINLHLEPDVGPYYIYFDASQASISLLLFATGADLVYALTGMSGVFIDGQNMQNSATYQAGEPNFPACP